MPITSERESTEYIQFSRRTAQDVGDVVATLISPNMLAEVIKLAMPYKVRQYREAVQGPRSEGAENTPQPPPPPQALALAGRCWLVSAREGL